MNIGLGLGPDYTWALAFASKLQFISLHIRYIFRYCRFYVTIVMHLRSYSSGGTTKFLT